MGSSVLRHNFRLVALCALLRVCGGLTCLIGGPPLPVQQRCSSPLAVATRPAAPGPPQPQPFETAADEPQPLTTVQSSATAAEQPQAQQQQDQVAGALERMLPRFSAGSVVSNAADSASAADLPGSWDAIDTLGNEGTAQQREQLLAESYEACRRITEQYAKTFYLGTKFFDEDKRKAVWAVYAWCRRTDDIVDKPRKETVSLRTELSEWGRRLKDVWRGRAHDVIDLALVDTVRKYPELAIEPFEDMVKGMVMDLDQNRFETFEELYIYCYRVAGTVGLMMMPIMGTAPGCTYQDALEPALALGVALQLTNILRDVGEDRVRQRIYLPQEDLRKFGVTEQALLKGIKNERYIAMLKFQIERAREWYKKAEGGIPMLSEDCQLPIRASLDMYSTILNKIEDNGYDNFNKRAYTAKWEKLAMLPRAYLRVKAPNLLPGAF
jgi:phytoene synthase